MPLRADHTYPPDLIEAMRLAFQKTCKALQLSDTDDVFTDIVAGPAGHQSGVGHQPQNPQALGLTVPQSILVRADKVIE